ncbi:TetR/AcrR family transcriptional regulator [Paenibacillus typhae]|nr:TetR/AcrR family transcriptional regulator [Paenibacillus typhae]
MLVREERKLQIIQAASRVFSRKGLAGAKMSDIAREAGLSHGHLYNHFKTKEELLATIVQMGQELYGRVLKGELAREGDAAGKLRRIAETVWFSGGMTGIYWVVLQTQASDVLPAETKAEISARMMLNLDLLTQIIEQGQREDTFTTGDPKEIATIAMMFLHNTGLWEIRGLGEPKHSMVDWLLKLVRK